jgi:hypothetical protein
VTGAPIGKATIIAWGYALVSEAPRLASATSDSAGHYALVVPGAVAMTGLGADVNGPVCDWGSLSVVADGFRYYDVTLSLTLHLKCVSTPQLLDLELTPGP